MSDTTDTLRERLERAEHERDGAEQAAESFEALYKRVYERSMRLEAENRRLREIEVAARDAERVMSTCIYPKPDVPPDHPYAVLGRLRKALAAQPVEHRAADELTAEAQRLGLYDEGPAEQPCLMCGGSGVSISGPEGTECMYCEGTGHRAGRKQPAEQENSHD